MTVIWILFLVFLKIGLFSIGGGYAIIPMRGQYTAKKKAAWRVYTTGNGSMTVDDGFDFGNGCGAAIRCVKNYKK